jgi:hypothetical protein
MLKFKSDIKGILVSSFYQNSEDFFYFIAFFIDLKDEILLSISTKYFL